MIAFLDFYRELQAPAPCFHVGGTNGKGSTTVILESALHLGLDLKVGRFSGPHILNWNERLSINSQSASQDDFAWCATKIKEYSSRFAQETEHDELSWFEVLTAMGLLYFATKKVDCIVLEVGLGGRFDATNAVAGIVSSIITNIELDHTHILGDSKEKIAAEKAGIIKDGIFVTTQVKGSGKDVIVEKAKEKNAPIFCLDQHFDDGIKLVDDWLLANGSTSATTKEILDSLSLSGEHQKLNALCALISIAKANCDIIDFSKRVSANTGGKLKTALANVYWPGRLQIISGGTKYPSMQIILDAAHNPNGAEILDSALNKMKINKRCYILGFFSNKDVPSILAKLLDRAVAGSVVIAYQADSHRQTMAKDEILKLSSLLRPDLETIHADSMQEAMQKASAIEKRGYTVVATGSFAVLKDVMKELGWNSVEHANHMKH
jgi:dihydrofolate synthase/folylpolyglutamate synthase